MKKCSPLRRLSKFAPWNLLFQISGFWFLILVILVISNILPIVSASSGQCLWHARHTTFLSLTWICGLYFFGGIMKWYLVYEFVACMCNFKACSMVFFNSAQVYETRWLLISLLLHIHRCIFANKYLSLDISRRIFLVAYFSSHICCHIFLVAYFSSHICRGKCLVQLYHHLSSTFILAPKSFKYLYE